MKVGKSKNRATIAAYGGLALCIVFFSIMTPIFGESIWSPAKLSTLISDVIVLALMSIGAVFVYTLGNIDISIGKQVGLFATLMVVLGNLTGSLLPGVAVSIVVALIFAVINGSTGDLLKMHPVIASVVVMMILTGISSITYSNLGSRNVALETIDYRIFKQTWLMVVVLLAEIGIVSFLYRYTRFGKNARAIGANKVVAEQSGINIIKYKVISYIIMGMCLVVASMFQMGYTGSSSDSTGNSFAMNVMVTLILGGMPLSGGMRGRISCAVVGAFTFSLLNVGLPMIGVAANQVFIIKAVIFLLVVFITSRRPGATLPR